MLGITAHAFVIVALISSSASAEKARGSIAVSTAAAASVLHVAPEGEPGTPLVVRGTVLDAKGKPIPAASLHVYQTDTTGTYTLERPMDEPHARLSGRVRTDSQGRFELWTVRPGGYPKPVRLGDRDRKIPAHIHIDVTAPGHGERRVQCVFADDPLLGDPYWKDWVRSMGNPVLEPHPDPERKGGVIGTITIVLDH